MNDLTVFNNEEFGQVRTVTIDNEPWFVGKDVAEALGYSNCSRDINRHVDAEDLRKYRLGTFPSIQQMIVINESGLYAMIFGSQLESAKRFKRWVISEVLPTIRKTGGYNATYDKMEIAKMILACKSAAAAKGILQLFEVQQPHVINTCALDNSVSEYLKTVEEWELMNLSTKKVYSDYVFYCKEYSIRSLSLSEFSKQIHKQTGLVVRRRRVNGVLTGFYMQNY